MDEYFYGSTRATITPDRIHGRPYQEKKVQTANVMQGAFNLYYNAYRAAMNFGAEAFDAHKYPNARKIISDQRSAMQADLRAAAHNSWVRNDLKWSFRHLEEKGGHWYDEMSDGYKQACNIPIGVSYFLAAVEERGRDVITKYSEWQRYTTNLKNLKDQSKWEELGKQLGYAQKVIDYAGPKLWVTCGASLQTAAQFSGLMSKWVGYGVKAHGYLDLYLKIRYNQAGAARAGIAELAAAVVEGLPVFGSLYAGVIRGIPGLVSWFEKYAATQRQYIDLASGR